jgi:hypothetical protein
MIVLVPKHVGVGAVDVIGHADRVLLIALLMCWASRCIFLYSFF